jgi:hypothetical protein
MSRINGGVGLWRLIGFGSTSGYPFVHDLWMMKA